MAHSALSRSQRNDILDIVRRHTLDPAGFQWPEKRDRGEVIEILEHPSTGAYFEFGLWENGGFWLAWWPSLF
jgi:exonuclease I